MREDTRKDTEKLVAKLQDLFGARLLSVCVYGSAVFDDAPAEQAFKNVNVLVILDGLDGRDLEKASPVAKWWDSVAHTLPMFLSKEEWLRSTDVYAMEAADIRDNHHVAFGQDFYSAVEVDREALRLICELELHRKLIFIRQRVLIYKDDYKALTRFLYESLNGFAALFRAVLRLSRDEVPQRTRAVLEEIGNIVPDYDPAPMLRVQEARDRNEKLAATEAPRLFESYITQIGRVVAYVDRQSGLLKEGV